MTRVQTPQASSQDKGANPGWVSFVGSGPGDPGLLTVRAVELIESAEVIVTETPDHVELVRTVLGLVEGQDGASEQTGGTVAAPICRSAPMGSSPHDRRSR